MYKDILEYQNQIDHLQEENKRVDDANVKFD
jgi:hypothetical protein